ncbi:MAG: carboxypeptidase-like regulatory domain-containing protein [Chitinophagaceae bacterium]
MKKHLCFLLALLSLVFSLSCRKDQAHEQYTELPPSIRPDLSVTLTTSVSGFVTDEHDKPVYGAQVKAGDKDATTDAFGYFTIRNAVVAETAGAVRISKPGYFQHVKTFIPQAGKESFVRAKLLPKVNTGSIDAASGGTVSAASSARVALPANGVVLAAGGTPYTGTVQVAIQWIDPADVAQQLSAAGDGRGLDTEGWLVYTRSFGTLAVELTGSSGQLLQVAAGKKATISIPVPVSMTGAAPATVALWSLDETSGLWKQESTAAKNGTVYTGEVSHFSFWTGAIGLPLVNMTAQIVDAALHPLANVAVGVRYAGQSFNAGGGTFGFTDANGIVTGAVPANTNLALAVLTPCALESYAHPFTTGNSNTDLGTIQGNLGQSLVTISGNVVDCSNRPVTDGYVQTFENGLFTRTPIVNGAFSFTGIACTNMATSLVAVDNTLHQQGAPQLISLTTGVNNLGTITACGTSTVGVINYTIDGVLKMLIEPANPLHAYFSPLAGGWTTVLELIPSPGTPAISFQFDGDAVTGNTHKVADIFCTGFPSGRALAPVPLTVTITDYGSPGGFISGNFSGPVLDFPTNSPHIISCDFRVRRYQ